MKNLFISKMKKKHCAMAVVHIVTQTFTFPPKKPVRRAYVCSFFALLNSAFSSSYTLLGYKIIENQSIYLITNSL